MAELNVEDQMPRSDEDWRNYVANSLRAGERRMDSLENGLLANTAMTEQTHDSTKKIVEAFNALEGGIKVMGWLGSLAKPVAVILFVCTTLYAAAHFTWEWVIRHK